MNYEEAILKIKSIEKIGSKPGLERIQRLLSLMGNPQKNMKFIHVAGTNGKGSVCYMLSNIIKESGYRTGLFISPSINSFRERIQVNNYMIPRNSVCEILEIIENCLTDSYFIDNPITEFEITTAIAFEYFKREKCDVVILETGMGGKLDATNVIDNPMCSVITTISMDHKEFLGNTILEIAKEKLGIIKNNSKVILGPNLPEAVYTLAKNISIELNSKCTITDVSKVQDFTTLNMNKSTFKYLGKNMEISLIGDHQRNNIAVVLEVINSLKNVLNISLTHISNGLKNVIVPCRIEIVNNSPLIILDASHNVESIEALVKFIEKNLKNKKITGIVGMFKDKDVENSIKILSGYLDKVIVIEANSSRAMKINDIKKIANKYHENTYSYKNISLSLKNTLNNISDNDVLIICGSFSIMKEAKKIIKFYF